MQTFSAWIFSQQMESQTFSAQSFGQKHAIANVCSRKCWPKTAAFQFENVCSHKFWPKQLFENIWTSEAHSFGPKLRSQNFAADNFGYKSRHVRFTNVCSAKFRSQISKLMSCKYFQRKVLVEKCDRKRVSAQSFGQKHAIANVCSQKFWPNNAAFPIGKRLQPKISAKTSVWKHLKRTVLAKKCVRKILQPTILVQNRGISSIFRFTNVCSAKFRPQI